MKARERERERERQDASTQITHTNTHTHTHTHTHTGKMLLTPSITINDYVVVALSLKFGTTELLDFVPTNPRLRYNIECAM